MKKLLLMIATVVAVVAPSTSQAIDNFEERYYIGLQGGANWLNRESIHNVHTNHHVGYFVNGTVGWRNVRNVRFEAEIGYRHNKPENLTSRFNDVKHKLNLHGHREAYSYMVNAVYDFPTSFYVKPYIGFGLGYAYTVWKSAGSTEFASFKVTDKRHDFAWQAIAGLAYPLEFLNCMDYDIDATVEYRYFEPNGFYSDQTLALGLRTYF